MAPLPCIARFIINVPFVHVLLCSLEGGRSEPFNKILPSVLKSSDQIIACRHLQQKPFIQEPLIIPSSNNGPVNLYGYSLIVQSGYQCRETHWETALFQTAPLAMLCVMNAHFFLHHTTDSTLLLVSKKWDLAPANPGLSVALKGLQYLLYHIMQHAESLLWWADAQLSFLFSTLVSLSVALTSVIISSFSRCVSLPCVTACVLQGSSSPWAFPRRHGDQEQDSRTSQDTETSKEPDSS